MVRRQRMGISGRQGEGSVMALYAGYAGKQYKREGWCQ
jgi:hypothetical protein